MGAETVGSIITPSSRAALYALKPTHGLQDMAGSYTLTDFFDSPGPMAKCAADVQALLEIILRKRFLAGGIGGWNDVRAGFVDPEVWKMAGSICRQHEGTAEDMVSHLAKHQGAQSPTDQRKSQAVHYHATMELLRSSGCLAKSQILVPNVSVLTVNGQDAIMPIACVFLPRQ